MKNLSESPIRVMLIGQDPTIFKNKDKVKTVLMLDDTNSQISRWLRTVFGKEFDSLSIYATNLVKCTLKIPPSQAPKGALNYLSPYFTKCKKYLIEEIVLYQPQLLITFGEPTHKFFITILDQHQIPDSMQKAFLGSFHLASVQGINFRYSPCLHIKTFRVAETYGDAVKMFTAGLKHFLR